MLLLQVLHLPKDYSKYNMQASDLVESFVHNNDIYSEDNFFLFYLYHYLSKLEHLFVFGSYWSHKYFFYNIMKFFTRDTNIFRCIHGTISHCFESVVIFRKLYWFVDVYIYLLFLVLKLLFYLMYLNQHNAVLQDLILYFSIKMHKLIH